VEDFSEAVVALLDASRSVKVGCGDVDEGVLSESANRMRSWQLAGSTRTLANSSRS
jgi:hypothetical protein